MRRIHKYLFIIAVIGLFLTCGCATKRDLQEETVALETMVESVIEDNATVDTNDIIHQKAKWSLNTMIDTDFPDIVFADDETVIFYAYFGLFVYDLKNEVILNSIDLKSLNCQKVQCGGKPDIQVSTDGKEIWITPFNKGQMYIYKIEANVLQETVPHIMETKFDRIVTIEESDIANKMGAKVRLCSNHVIAFPDNTYGYIYTESAEISTMTYCRDNEVWYLFQEKDSHEGELLRQDDSFYKDYRNYADVSLQQFIYIYTLFYESRDFAGICVLSKNLTYSDEVQRAWREEGSREIQVETQNINNRDKQELKVIEGDSEKILYLVCENGVWYAEGLPQ